MATAERLEALADDVAAGKPLAPEDARLVAQAVRALITGVGPNGASAMRAADHRERDRHLVELARCHCRHIIGIRAQARQILAWARRYEATGWPREQHIIEIPEHRRDKPEGYIWAALKASPRMPGDTTLREILKNSKV